MRFLNVDGNKKLVLRADARGRRDMTADTFYKEATQFLIDDDVCTAHLHVVYENEVVTHTPATSRGLQRSASSSHIEKCSMLMFETSCASACGVELKFCKLRVSVQRLRARDLSACPCAAFTRACDFSVRQYMLIAQTQAHP